MARMTGVGTPSICPPRGGAKSLRQSIDRLAIGVDERRATIDAERPKRDDEIGKLQLRDQEPVDETASEPHDEARYDSKRHVVAHQVGGDHARQTDDGPHGQIDAPRDDDEGHADGDDRVDRRLKHDVDQIRRLVEAARQDRKDREQADASDQHAGLAEKVAIDGARPRRGGGKALGLGCVLDHDGLPVVA